MRPALLLVLLLLVVEASAAPGRATSLCDMEGCVCNATAHRWLNVTCEFDSKQVVELGPGAAPPNMLELELSGCKELRLLEDALSGARALRRVKVRGVGRLQLRRHAFRDAGDKHARLDVVSCGGVVVESHAFRGAAGPLSAALVGCAHVVLQGAAFSWLLAVEVSDVPRLELAQHAFAFESRSTGRHGPATTVLLRNVIAPELPPHAFPSSAAQLRLTRVEARVVRRDAFSAVALSAVLLHNSSLHVVEEGAFSAKTLVEQLHLGGLSIRELRQGAVQAGVTNLTIQHSNISEVSKGALNITVATVQLSDNVFGAIHTGGLVFKNWNRVYVDRNVFPLLETDAVAVPFVPVAGVYSYEFSFSENTLGAVRPGALSFVAEATAASPGLAVRVLDNVFAGEACRCDLEEWVRAVAAAGRGDPRDLYDSCLCAVSEALTHCFDVAAGAMPARNFTSLVCGAGDVIVCDEGPGRRDPVVGAGLEVEVDRERKVLGLIFVAVVCGMCAVLLATAALWLRRKGHCARARLALLPVLSRLCQGLRESRLVAAASARSISRLSAREYAELQQQQHKHKHEPADTDELVAYENKWTQTLPEELTQELLESLKEKLDDPEKYGEARDMIEQLYDLIKIEESCSNNNASADEVAEDEENVYDVIRATPADLAAASPSSRPRHARSTCTVGTRAPSPDKLLPAPSYTQLRPSRRPALVCEYVEPRDREHHVYTELPSAASAAGGGPRPLSFLRALGESLHVARGGVKAPSAAVCEYAEPTDAAVHVYSELPACARPMANRPLPTKPQDVDPGEGTSS